MELVILNKKLCKYTDYGAHHEKTETLEELVTSKTSPWNLDYSWSDEAKQLREIAVRSPWLIDNRFVQNHFKTLRISDKGVSMPVVLVNENMVIPFIGTFCH